MIAAAWTDVVLTAANMFQIVALAWIAAWQQRAALEVRRLNGVVASEVRSLARRTSSGTGFPAAVEPGPADTPR